MKANDRQEGGDHYKRLQPEPWDVIAAWKLGYFDGSALKYIARWRNKGGVEDLKKAIHYLEKQVEVEDHIRGNEIILIGKAISGFLEMEGGDSCQKAL